MTRLAVIGDIHGHERHLSAVLDAIAAGPRVDGVLLVGDIGANTISARRKTGAALDAYLQSLEAMLEMVRGLGVPVRWVPGNHDLPDAPGEGNVDGTVDVIGDLRVAGIGGAGPQRFGFCYEWGEDEVRGRSVPDSDVLLVHCPPKNTPLDRVPAQDVHVGSEAVRERVESHTGFFVCGHIHESPSVVQIGECLCMNVGGLGRPFGRAQVGWIWRDGDHDHVRHLDLGSGEEHELVMDH